MESRSNFGGAGRPDEESVEEEFSPQVKKALLIACLVALFVGNMMLLNVAAFLPDFINENFSDPDNFLDETDGALIIGIFSVAQIVFAPFNSNIKNFFGSKNTILFGFALMTVTTFGLGFIARVKDANTFRWLALFIRFF